MQSVDVVSLSTPIRCCPFGTQELIEENKELKGENAQLKSRLDSLEARIASLESMN